MKSNTRIPVIATLDEPGSWLEVVRRQVATLQFGVIQITVHESNVVQIERTEKVRIGPGTVRTNLTADQSTGGSTTHPGSPT